MTLCKHLCVCMCVYVYIYIYMPVMRCKAPELALAHVLLRRHETRVLGRMHQPLHMLRRCSSSCSLDYANLLRERVIVRVQPRCQHEVQDIGFMLEASSR